MSKEVKSSLVEYKDQRLLDMKPFLESDCYNYLKKYPNDSKFTVPRIVQILKFGPENLPIVSDGKFSTIVEIVD